VLDTGGTLTPGCKEPEGFGSEDVAGLVFSTFVFTGNKSAFSIDRHPVRENVTPIMSMVFRRKSLDDRFNCPPILYSGSAALIL
jgi:hypothetical protein